NPAGSSLAFDSGQEVALTLEREPRHLGGEQTFFPVPKLRLAGATPLRASRALFALRGPVSLPGRSRQLGASPPPSWQGEKRASAPFAAGAALNALGRLSVLARRLCWV